MSFAPADILAQFVAAAVDHLHTRLVHLINCATIHQPTIFPRLEESMRRIQSPDSALVSGHVLSLHLLCLRSSSLPVCLLFFAAPR